MSKLRAIQSTQTEYGINHEAQFDRIRRDILDLAMVRQQDGEIQIATQVARLDSLNTKLAYLLEEYTLSPFITRSSKVCTSAKYIEGSDKDSNDWIYEEELTPYVTWLESGSQKDSMFYIQGKVGPDLSTGLFTD